MSRSFRGGCHCGHVQVVLETSIAPHDLPLRACQCAFCRRHGAVTASDPSGRLRVEVAQADALHRYRFALGMTDFLLCRACGVYVAATMPSGAGALGVLNVNVLDERELFDRAPEPMRYGAEDAASREARRAKVWMPVAMGSV